ncbi:hypothetical protein HY486_01450 [Candidatus Woesearchaeota archaeon]|nr:hypothetical protein [Candidatus Woesearchaeota archaeon]
MAHTLDKIVTFLRVSPIQQAIVLGIVTPFTITYILSVAENYSKGNTINGNVDALFALAGIGLSLLNEHVAIRNMKEHDKIKDALDRHGWNENIIESKSHSWCQRNTSQVASNDSGFGGETRKYLHEKGYRRYHFVPDAYIPKWLSGA